MQPHPRSRDLVWPGHLHGAGCLSARAVGTGFPTVGLRWWLGPGCGWSLVLFSPARRGWGLGWVCLGSVCGVVPLLPAVCGVRGSALVSAPFRDVCGFVRVSLAPRRFRFRCAVWACVLGPGLGCAPPFLAGLSGCVFCAFFFSFFFFSGFWTSPSRALWSLPPSPFFSAGLLFFSFLWVSACFGAPFPGGPLFLAWCCRFLLGGLPVPVWGSCLPCLLGGGFGLLLCFWRAVWWLCVAGVWVGSLATPGGGSCVLLPATPGWVSLPVVVGGPRHSWLGSAGGGGVWCVVCGGGVLVGLWLVRGVVGPSPLLAEVPVCYSPPLLAGFRCRWWWADPATPGWGPLAALLCGVWCVAVVCWWGCGWCVVWLVPRHSWRRFLCATPRHSWLGLAAGGGGRSPPLLAGVRWRWCCVVCGVWRWCAGGVVAGAWCSWSLATPGGGPCVLLPATPGWVLLPLVVGGPRHSWLGSVGGVAVWCVVCGGGVLVGLWLVCGVVGPSPLLAVVPLCFSPPLLPGFRCRWWLAVPATPGWGPLAAVVCGVWCVVCGGGVLLGLWLVCGVWQWCVVGVVVGVWCGWSLATPGCGLCVLLPATPGRVSLPVVVGGPRHSWLGSVGGSGVWCVVCGVLVGSLATPGGGSCVLLPATPGWVSLAAVVCDVWCVVCGGGVLLGLWLVCGVVGPSPLLAEVLVCYSPPLLAGFRCRWWWAVPATPGWGPLAAVVCGVWCVVCGGGVLLGLWLVCGVVGPSPLLAEVPVCYSPPLLAGFRCRWWWAVPATPGWGPLAAVVCGVWCVGGVPRHSWRRFLCATPRHSWLGLAAVGGGRSPPLLAGVRWRRWRVVCVPVRARLARSGGPASWARSGAPHLLFWPLCLPALPGPLRAGVAPLSFAAVAVPRWLFFSASRCLALRALPSRLCLPLGRWLLLGGCSPAPLPFCVSRFSSLLLGALVFFFFFFSLLLLLPLCAPVVSGFLWFPAPGALGLGACVVCFVCLLFLGSPCACRSFVLSAWLLAAPAWLLPPPLCVSRFSFLPLGAVCRVVPCFPGCGAAPRCCALCRPVFCCRVLCCARVVPLLVAPCPLALPVALGPCALRRCVLRCSPALCALCCVCFVVARWCVLLFAALPCAVCVSGCCAVRSLCSPFCAVLCSAVLVRSCRAVRVVHAAAGAWCCGALLCVVLFPVVCRGAVLGLVARGCLLVACFGVGVPVWPRGLLPCCWCGLLWCPAFLCRVLRCCAVAWCSAVVLWCRVAVLLGLVLPSCGLSCCAVLCCWLAVLSLARWCVLWCSFPRAVRSLSSPLCALRCLVVLAVVPCFPVSCAVALCCRVVLCCRFAVLFVLALPSCGLSCGASVVCAVVGASCCGVSLCVVVSPWAFCGVVVLLWCVVVSCCAVGCPVVSCALCRVLRCRAALRCCAVCFSFCPVFLC